MDEHFICEACRCYGHIHALYHRRTMPGDYCKNCARIEICAACLEAEPVVTVGRQSGRLLCWHCISRLIFELAPVSRQAQQAA